MDDLDEHLLARLRENARAPVAVAVPATRHLPAPWLETLTGVQAWAFTTSDSPIGWNNQTP